MIKRMLQTLAIIHLVILLSSSMASAQGRRQTRRAPVSRPHLAPLTGEQKEAVVGIIEQAKAIEITHNYHPEKYANAAYFIWSECHEVSQILPDGSLQNLVLELGNVNYAASLMYGVYMPEQGGILHAFVASEVAEGKTTDPIPDIIRTYKLERMTPYEAQRALFNYASILNQRLQLFLSASPTTRRSQSSGRTNSNTASKQEQTGARASNNSSTQTELGDVEQNAQRLSGQIDKQAQDAYERRGGSPEDANSQDWAFPKPGMRSHYNEDIKGNIYYLGDGLYAGHTKLNGEPIVIVVFATAIPENKINDADLTYLIASKVIELPHQLADTALPLENNYEHRFRTAHGKVVVVTLAYDRKTAIVRLIQ